MQNGVAARVPSDLQQHGALIPRPKTPDGAKRGSSSALACFGGGKVPAQPAIVCLPPAYPPCLLAMRDGPPGVICIAVPGFCLMHCTEPALA